jgi:hypothetical protein
MRVKINMCRHAYMQGDEATGRRVGPVQMGLLILGVGGGEQHFEQAQFPALLMP